jgi:hypothetical protein
MEAPSVAEYFPELFFFKSPTHRYLLVGGMD